MLDKFIDILYPPVCGICGKIDKNSLCNKCKIQLKKQAAFGKDTYSKETHFFDEHLYIFIYSGIIRKILINYKFNDNSYLYKTFTNFLLKNEKYVKNIEKYDIITAVPLSKNRKKERGYNQSNLIAKEISKKTKIKFDNRILKKHKNIIAQSYLNREDRQKNIEGAYLLNKSINLEGKNVLIVDDVFTTGSTANECSKILRNTKPKSIGILTIAKD